MFFQFFLLKYISNITLIDTLVAELPDHVHTPDGNGLKASPSMS